MLLVETSYGLSSMVVLSGAERRKSTRVYEVLKSYVNASGLRALARPLAKPKTSYIAGLTFLDTDHALTVVEALAKRFFPLFRLGEAKVTSPKWAY
jgi:hypothetical protein